MTIANAAHLQFTSLLESDRLLMNHSAENPISLAQLCSNILGRVDRFDVGLFRFRKWL